MPTNMHKMYKDNPIRPFSKINIIYQAIYENRIITKTA